MYLQNKSNVMKMKPLYYLLTLLLCSACINDDNNALSECDKNVLISQALFNNAPNDYFTINNLSIEGDCLKINFGASGCDGSSWKIQLIDSEQILESFPPQRIIKFSLDNKEACEAFFTKEISFDISKLQVDGGKVYLNIANTEHQILYEY
jgi:hypothetical protein